MSGIQERGGDKNCFPITGEQKARLKEALFERWRELNERYLKFGHKENYREVLRERVVVERQLDEVERILEMLKQQERVFLETN